MTILKSNQVFEDVDSGCLNDVWNLYRTSSLKLPLFGVYVACKCSSDCLFASWKWHYKWRLILNKLHLNSYYFWWQNMNLLCNNFSKKKLLLKMEQNSVIIDKKFGFWEDEKLELKLSLQQRDEWFIYFF